MGTFATIQTRVQTRVIDLPTAVQAEIPQLINEAMRNLQVDHNFKIMEATFTEETATGTRILAPVPSDFKEYRDEPWHTSNEGIVYRLTTAAERHAIWQDISEQDIGYPLVILDNEPDINGNRNFEVYPLPDGNSTYTDGQYPITIPYWRFVPTLVNGSDTNWFTVNAEQFLVYQATSEAFSLDWDENRMAIWAQRAEVQRKRVVKQDKLFRLAGVDAFVPHWRGMRDSRLRY